MGCHGQPTETAKEATDSAVDVRGQSGSNVDFVSPSPCLAPSIVIEFCDRCRWLHRATWISTELFLTFPPPILKGMTIIPLNDEETAGRFRVWLNVQDSETPVLIWDRKTEGGFPELKQLKQRVRDRIDPGKSLGHSDVKH